MNARPPTDAARFTALLSRFPPAVIALVKATVPKLRRAVPYSHQVVYEYASSVVVSYGMSERGYEAIVAMSVTANGVQLYFDKTLPDPKGLLRGTGTKVRSLMLASAADLDRRDVQALIKAAVAQAGVDAPHAGVVAVIFKSDAKTSAGRKTAKQSPAKPAKKAAAKAAQKSNAKPVKKAEAKKAGAKQA